MYDVVIVGAGPAGATAGKWCAVKGLKAVIVEKHKLPRPKVCAGGLPVRALQMIESPIPSNIVEREIFGYDFVSPSIKVAQLRSSTPIAITVFRDKFDKFLVDQALSSGCRLLQGRAVVDVEVERDFVKCRLSSGRTLRTHMIIDASGLTGIVARKTGMGRRTSMTILCCERTLQLTDEKLSKYFDPNVSEIYFSEKAMGYGWVFPRSRSVSIGFGALLDRKWNLYKEYTHFCQTLSRLKKLDFAMEPFNTLAISTLGDPMKAVADRRVLTGDAAGFADPFSGEGVHFAMKSGKLAALAALNSFDEGDFCKSHLQEAYSKACEKEFAGDLRVSLKWAKIFHRCLELFVDILRHGGGEVWIRNAQGKFTYEGLEKEIIRGLPIWLLQVYYGRLQGLIGLEK